MSVLADYLWEEQLHHPSSSTEGHSELQDNSSVMALLSGDKFLLDQYLLNKQQGWAS